MLENYYHQEPDLSGVLMLAGNSGRRYKMGQESVFSVGFKPVIPNICYMRIQWSWAAGIAVVSVCVYELSGTCSMRQNPADEPLNPCREFSASQAQQFYKANISKITKVSR